MLEDTDHKFGELRAACQMEPSVWAWLRIYEATRAFHYDHGVLLDQVLPYVESRMRTWPAEIVRTTPAYDYTAHSTGQTLRLQADDPGHELSFGDSLHVIPSSFSGANPWRGPHAKPALRNMRHVTFRGVGAEPCVIADAICGTELKSLTLVVGGLTYGWVRSELGRALSEVSEERKTALTSLSAPIDFCERLLSVMPHELAQLTRVRFSDMSLDVIRATNVLYATREVQHLDLSMVQHAFWGVDAVSRVASRMLVKCPAATHLSMSYNAFGLHNPNDFGTDLLTSAQSSSITELSVKYHTGGYAKMDFGVSLLDHIGRSKFTRLNLVEEPLGPISTWSGLFFQGHAFGSKAVWFHQNVLEVWFPRLAKAATIEHLDLSGLGARAMCTSKLPRPSAAFQQYDVAGKGIVHVLRARLGDLGGFPNLKRLTLDARLKRHAPMWEAVVAACAGHGVEVAAKWHNPFER